MGSFCAGLLCDPAPAQALLALLLAGHFLGDFLFQDRRMVSAKIRPRVLLLHGLLVTLAHLFALLPLWSIRVIVAALAIGPAHVLIDAVKPMWRAETTGRPADFFLDQAAHIIVVSGAWFLLREFGTGPRFYTFPDEWMTGFLFAIILLAGFAFNWSGGSAIVRAVLGTLDPKLEEREKRSGLEGSGHLIGILERVLALILILLGQWAAMVLLVTAKSIARFEELKERRFAEYYLVGTLTSLLVAVVTGLLLSGLVLAQR